MVTVLVPLLSAWLAAQTPPPAGASEPPPSTPATAPTDAAPAGAAAPDASAPNAGGPAPEAPPVATPAPTPAAPAPPRLVRIVVQEVEVPPGEDRLRAIFTSSLVSEVRKLQGVSVLGLDEVRALLEVEANRQTAGCDEAGCLAELADALGAGVVVNARLSTLGDENLIAFRRLDAATGKVIGVDRRFARSNGEEFLAAIGPAVAELFPDMPLRSGLARGVDKEAGLKLNPPPLAPWMFVTLAASSAVALGVGGGAGALSTFFEGSADEKVARSVAAPVDAIDVKRDADAADGSALVANTAFVVGGALAATAAAAFFFTDFAGYADAP